MMLGVYVASCVVTLLALVAFVRWFGENVELPPGPKSIWLINWDHPPAPWIHWWLSFATDEGNLGCCIVEAPSFEMAVMVSHNKGINPGGQVDGYPLLPGSQATSGSRACCTTWG